MSAQDKAPHTPSSAPSRDAVRSRAWRGRHGQYLRGLLDAAGIRGDLQPTRSTMAQLKRAFPAVWAQALTEAPASMIRHDPALPRAERRRISSVKNNRLCRHRHHVFLRLFPLERHKSHRPISHSQHPTHNNHDLHNQALVLPHNHHPSSQRLKPTAPQHADPQPARRLAHQPLPLSLLLRPRHLHRRPATLHARRPELHPLRTLPHQRQRQRRQR